LWNPARTNCFIAPVPTPRLPVLQAIERRFDALPPMLQRAARYVSDRPSEVAVRSMRTIAQDAGVAPATVLRLAYALGYSDYRGFRDVFIRELTEEPASYRKRGETLQNAATSEPAAIHPRIGEAQARAVSSVLQKNSAASFQKAAAQIARARRVGFLGLRASHAVAFYFYYVYGLVKENGVLLADTGGTFHDQLENLGPRDCLVAASISPYTLATVHAVEHAASRRVPVVAITDNAMSPIARPARHHLLCATEAPSFFSSMTGPLAVVEHLAARIAAGGGRQALARLRATDSRMKSIHAYWDVAWTRPSP
jgi:DNA-binding MurR/RpiR family transcriptional regulator